MEDATAMSASLVRVSPSVLLYRTAGHEAEVVPDVQGSGLRLPGDLPSCLVDALGSPGSRAPSIGAGRASPAPVGFSFQIPFSSLLCFRPKIAGHHAVLASFVVSTWLIARCWYSMYA
ncbi:hypothetical protein BHE74_00005140 [Ensete ventricosum]|nr:hypothetical protein BHE74_00005140 [Ensete ventricosum]